MTKALFVFCILLPQFALACGCVGDRPEVGLESRVESALRRNTAVFIGEVTNVEIIAGEKRHSDVTEIVEYHVIESFKGVTESKFVTGSQIRRCGQSFDRSKGKTYLVYAHENFEREGSLEVSRCDRTREIENASGDLPILRKKAHESGQ